MSVAIADLGESGRPDVIVFTVDSVPGQNSGFFGVGRDLDRNGDVMGGWTPWIPVPDWFPWENAGVSATVADLGDTGRPDLIVLMVDHPPGENSGYYRVGHDLDRNGDVMGGWSAWIQVPEWPSSEREDVSIAVADLYDSGRRDLLVSIRVGDALETAGEQDVRLGGSRWVYCVGRDLDTNGKVAGGWTPWTAVPYSSPTDEPLGESRPTDDDPAVQTFALGPVAGRVVTVSAFDDGTLRAWDFFQGQQVGESVSGLDESVAVAVGEGESGLVVVSAGSDGTARVWDLSARDHGVRDQVEWVSDVPATRDELNRKPVADMLAERLRRAARTGHEESASESGSFLVHLDGRWGAGKSSILNFLREELERADDSWIVVDFNAWQQARLGPPWWTLLTSLRRRLLKEVHLSRRWRFRTAEAWHRVRITGAPYVLALVLLVAVLGGVLLAVGPENLSLSKPEKLAKALTAILTVGAVLWAGVLVLSRFMLWDSVTGARVFEQSNRNPTTYLREHFTWIIQRAGRPVIWFIDDLDRCEQAYVVELLDGIQTLIRDVGKQSAVTTDNAERTARAGSHGPFFVVAADGGWIRASYEEQYSKLADAIAEPGRALGYLFLEKLFQLTVSVPTLSMTRQDGYLKTLLSGNEKEVNDGRQERARVEAKIRASRTQAEVHRAWKNASPDIREQVGQVAVKKLTDEAVQAATQHELQKFAPLLERNPRGMKRFLNTYTADLVTFGLEDNFVDSDALALWTILRMRWPTLVDYLRMNPPAVEWVGQGPFPKDLDAAVRAVFAFPELSEVVKSKHGGPLTPALVQRLAGRSSALLAFEWVHCSGGLMVIPAQQR